MKKLTLAMLLVLAAMLASCGGSSTSTDNINGNWTASLSGTEAFSFNVTLNTQPGTSDLMVSNLNFNPATVCFPTGATGPSGTFTSSGVVNGVITGPFNLTIGSMFPGPTQNLLSMQGNVNGKTITGTWTLTGGIVNSCTVGSGTFTMTRV